MVMWDDLIDYDYGYEDEGLRAWAEIEKDSFRFYDSETSRTTRTGHGAASMTA